MVTRKTSVIELQSKTQKRVENSHFFAIDSTLSRTRCYWLYCKTEISINCSTSTTSGFQILSSGTWIWVMLSYFSGSQVRNSSYQNWNSFEKWMHSGFGNWRLLITSWPFGSTSDSSIEAPKFLQQFLKKTIPLVTISSALRILSPRSKNKEFSFRDSYLQL